MKSKMFVFRTSDEKVIAHLQAQKEINSYVVTLINADMKGIPASSNLKDQKTLQETLQLKLKNQLWLVHELKLDPALAIKVSKGELDLIDVLSTKYAKQNVETFSESKGIDDNWSFWSHFCHAENRKIELRREAKRCVLCDMSQLAEDVIFT